MNFNTKLHVLRKNYINGFANHITYGWTYNNCLYTNSNLTIGI